VVDVEIYLENKLNSHFLMACIINFEGRFLLLYARTRVYYGETTGFVKIIDRIQA
jgi:hypothetical protein